MDYQGSANNPCSSDAFSKSVHESNQNDVKNGLGIESSCFSMRLWEATVTDRYTVVRCLGFVVPAHGRDIIVIERHRYDVLGPEHEQTCQRILMKETTIIEEGISSIHSIRS